MKVLFISILLGSVFFQNASATPIFPYEQNLSKEIKTTCVIATQPGKVFNMTVPEGKSRLVFEENKIKYAVMYQYFDPRAPVTTKGPVITLSIRRDGRFLAATKGKPHSLALYLETSDPDPYPDFMCFGRY